MQINTEDWILAGQLQDKNIKEIYETLQKTPGTKQKKKIHKNYKISNNKVYKKYGTKNLWLGQCIEYSPWNKSTVSLALRTVHVISYLR